MNYTIVILFIKTLLRETQDGPVLIDKLRSSLKITNEAFTQIIEELRDQNVLTISDGLIELSVEQRLNLAVKAISEGADSRAISESLGWLEFENLTAYVFEQNGFHTQRRFRFNAEGRRWEIDVVALQNPYIVCAECKHWTKVMGNNTARTIIETHLEKCEVFSRHICELSKKLRIQRWTEAIILPITLTLSKTEMRIYRRVPSVSILTLPSFLEGFQGQIDLVVRFDVKLPKFRPIPTQTRLR